MTLTDPIMRHILDDEAVVELLVACGLEKAPPRVEEEFLELLSENIFQRFLLEAAQQLPEDAVPELAHLKDKNPDEAMQLLKKHLPHFAEQFAAAAKAEIEETKAHARIK